ncbi:GatB/YqeY domain-containing protein [Patescibacteria group bacterium]|nr:GatB/YqeY domain-containing protein [Patescibacteria group bacterium]
MNIREKIENDLKDAMKSGDNIIRGVLRMLNSDIKNVEIDLKKKLANDDIVKILKRNIKSRRDSIEQYKKGNREDLAVQEEKELKILEKYMPEQMSEEEIRKIVIDIIKKSEASGASDFGKVMGAVIKKTGRNVDGNVVSRIVKEELK